MTGVDKLAYLFVCLFITSLQSCTPFLFPKDSCGLVRRCIGSCICIQCSLQHLAECKADAKETMKWVMFLLLKQSGGLRDNKHKTAVSLRHKAPLFSVIKRKCCFGSGCFEKNSKQENLIFDKYSWGLSAHSVVMTTNLLEGRKNHMHLKWFALPCTCGLSISAKPPVSGSLSIHHWASPQIIHLHVWGSPRVYPLSSFDRMSTLRIRRNTFINLCVKVEKQLKGLSTG